MNHCNRIHLKDFCFGIIGIPIRLFMYIIVSTFLIICGTIWITILSIKGEPTGNYDVPSMINFKDKRLRFKKDKMGETK